MKNLLILLVLFSTPVFAQRAKDEDVLAQPLKLDKVVINIEYRNKRKFLKREARKQQAIVQILKNEKEKAITAYRSTVVSETNDSVTETKRDSKFEFRDRFTSKVYIVSMNEIQCPYREISDEVRPGLFRRFRVAQLEIQCTLFPIVTGERPRRPIMPGEVKRSAKNASYNDCVDLFEKYNSDLSKVSELALVGKFKNGCGRCVLDQASNGTDNYLMRQYKTLSTSSPYHFLKPSSTEDISSTDRGADSWLPMKRQLQQIEMILLQDYCNPESDVY
ncbi:MAG: hypothetical protein KA715_09660 [Xanthomonadaceae bacterium]|nr:hypothetical protein [Xanthomonadaceae bacterium]